MERFSTHQASYLSGRSFRQLDAWARDGLVQPERGQEGAGGPKHWRRWSFRDVTIAAVLGCVPDEWRREVADHLRELPYLLDTVSFAHGYCRLEIDLAAADAEVRERAMHPRLPLPVRSVRA